MGPRSHTHVYLVPRILTKDIVSVSHQPDLPQPISGRTSSNQVVHSFNLTPLVTSTKGLL